MNENLNPQKTPHSWGVFSEDFGENLQHHNSTALYLVFLLRQPLKWFPASAEIIPGVILGLHPANERRRYFVTASLIGWVQT